MQGRTRKQNQAAERERAQSVDVGNADKHLVLASWGGFICKKHGCDALQGKSGLYYCPQCKEEGDVKSE